MLTVPKIWISASFSYGPENVGDFVLGHNIVLGDLGV